MKYGIVTSWGSIADYITMAQEAEACGWDGIFAWDDIAVGPREVFDPWVTLGAMAAVTERITLGAMVFSLARRRPWKVARESLSLDNLSNGRLVIPVGLGGTWDGGYSRVNTDDPDKRIRAAKLDECLDILKLAWTGEPFSYTGTHYQATDLQFRPMPVQRPHIPVWAVGAWPYVKSLGRAARWDGIIPADMSEGADPEAPVKPETVAQISQWMAKHRTTDAPIEIVLEGRTSGTDHDANRDQLGPLAEAGATWWIESRWELSDTPESLLDRIRQGPPQV